jgi:DNA polymerase I-like protein with 3'-5' exonuclease and polymerase domains
LSSLNCQQLPKNRKFLECFEPKPGYILAYLDFSAIEPHVLTYYSRAKELMRLYGPGMKPNDAYLNFGSKTTIYGERLRQAGYDPDNPTPEMIKQLKIEFSHERDNILKPAYLSLLYKIEKPALWRDLKLKGVDISFESVSLLWYDFWRMHPEIKELEADLLEQYWDNKGWILNGRRRPLCIPRDHKKLKDIINRFVQSTAHDLLLAYLAILDRLRKERNLPMIPWLVDEHDATVWQTPIGTEPQTEKAFLDAVEELNQQLQWDIIIKGSFKTGKNFGEIKC